jgi:hypothetical protein
MKWFQNFRFNKSRYERPNQKWVCGYSKEGWSCPQGPNSEGKCCATSECQPYKKGDRWFCSRSESQGGPCQEGPLPTGACSRPIVSCQPLPSMRSWRGRTTVAVMCAAVAVVVILLFGPQHQKMKAPGPMSTHHAPLAANCDQCHTIDKNEAAGISLGNLHKPKVTQSQRCLECHSNFNVPDFQKPHSLSPDEIVKISERIKKSGGSPSFARKLLPSVPHSKEGDLECSTCHREHRGDQMELTVMSPGQCQPCHVQQFQSLGSGHPPFGSYPYKRRTPITFNHDSHINGYFATAKGKAPSSCTDCHTSDSTRQEMVFKGFQENCASCHTPMIAANPDDKTAGVALVRIPALDLAELRKRNASIGQYPANATGNMTVFTKLLLAGDPKYPELAQDLITLQPLPSWEDLSEVTPEQQAALQRLILAMKRLLVDCSTRGKEALRARLQQATGPRLTPDIIEYLLRPFPIESMKNLQLRVFPQAVSELASDHSKLGTIASHQGADSTDYSILYQAKKHTDNYLQSWLTAASVAKPAKALFDSSPQLHQGFPSCVICHSVEADKNQNVFINWKAKQHHVTKRPLTKFSHGPHLSLNCNHCHTLQEAVDQQKFMNSFKGLDPTVVEPVFRSIKKEDCSQCHKPGVANDNCLNCHHYHVGDFEPRVPLLKSFKPEEPTAPVEKK